MIKLACVACMDENKSVHTTTWLRALELAQAYLLPAQVTLKQFDDNASAQKAAEAAGEIVTWSPDAVVGHFASAAAEAAAPIYARHNLPLFLPAATAKHLTGYATTWRLCDNDEDYVSGLLSLLTSAERNAMNIEHDGSVHGISVAQRLSAALKPTEDPPHGATTFFAGQFRHALARAIDWAHSSVEDATLILADDAFSAELVPALLASDIDLTRRKIFVAAITPQPTGELAARLALAWARRWGGTPGCYFWETMAALQVACSYPDLPAETVLGKLNFDSQRESHPGSFSFWQAKQHGLHKCLMSEVRI